MTPPPPSLKSFSVWGSPGVGWINIWKFSVRWRHSPVWLQERRYVAEDAVLGEEDGDCVEAAEEPPELMPGESTGQTHNL